MSEQVPLVLVSNRGPVTFDARGETQRGSGGVVTALTRLATHREAIWIASAMSEYDAEPSRDHGGPSFPVRSPPGDVDFRVRLVVSDPDAYDRFYGVGACLGGGGGAGGRREAGVGGLPSASAAPRTGRRCSVGPPVWMWDWRRTSPGPGSALLRPAASPALHDVPGQRHFRFVLLRT